MIVAVDVYYRDINKALVAGVVFKNFLDQVPFRTYTVAVNEVFRYVPGSFYLRELPCIMALLNEIEEDIETVIIDGYVSLGEKPGLGVQLWKALGGRKAIIGVAKSHFRGSVSKKIFRGKSNNPLYITSSGIETSLAASMIGSMHGNFRIPTLLKLADTLSRKLL